MTTRTPSLPNQNTKPLNREDLLNPWPKITIGTIALTLAIVLLYWWGFVGTKASPGELISGIPNIINLIRRMFPPIFAMTTDQIAVPFGIALPYLGSTVALTVPEVIPAIFETIQMALIGTTLGIIISIPPAFLAARNTTPHPAVYQATRFLLNSMRAVPGLIVALIFVASVGLGPFAGVLALALGEIGVLSKLFAEAIEAIDPQQVQAVRATGANRYQVFMYGVLPQALPVSLSYTLLVFEGNVRNATALGIVGAGGVGFTLAKYMALFQYQRLVAALILIIVTVTIIDRFSDAIRRRLI